MPDAVLIQDGQRLEPPTGGPAAVLSARSAGAYTTARVDARGGVVDWPLHLERLARNIECLHAERPPLYSPFVEWCRRRGREPAGVVKELAEPQARAALAALAGSGSDGSGSSSSSSSGSGGDAMLVVVVNDRRTAGSPALSPEPPLSVTAYCKRAAAAAPAEAVTVAVRGAPRQWAAAKHCEWVAQRKALEEWRSAVGAAEVVLTDFGAGKSDGGGGGSGGGGAALLEGLLTNFFVVAEVAPPGPAGSGGSGSSSGDLDLARFELQTAAATRSGPSPVLPGIVQRRVAEAAAGLGLRASGGPPRAGGRDTWREAFITNALKGLQPVNRIIFWPDRNAPHWEVVLPTGRGAGPVTRLLQARTAELQQSVRL